MKRTLRIDRLTEIKYNYILKGYEIRKKKAFSVNILAVFRS